MAGTSAEDLLGHATVPPALSAHATHAASKRLLIKCVVGGALVIAASMVLLSYLLSTKVSSLVTQLAAQEIASVITTSLTPASQDLDISPRLSEQRLKEIDALQGRIAGVRSIKIWLKDGTIVYAADRSLIGKRYPSETLNRAFSGQIISTYDDLDDAENEAERRLKSPLIEVYAPIVSGRTGQVLAVGEFYKDATIIDREIRLIQIAAVTLVCLVTIPMCLVLLLVTARATQATRVAQDKLDDEIEVTRALAAHNDRLRIKAEEARHNSLVTNELFVEQLSQDIHDGPIQLITIANLKLSPANEAVRDDEHFQHIASAASLNEKALKQLRDLLSGMALPELDGLTLNDAIELAIQEHEAVTEVRVQRTIEQSLPDVTRFMKIAMFRIVQEGLNNAYRHAGAAGQSVAARVVQDRIEISVIDRGKRSQQTAVSSRSSRSLGLIGLKRRVALLQGELNFATSESGSKLTALIPIDKTDVRNAF